MGVTAEEASNKKGKGGVKRLKRPPAASNKERKGRKEGPTPPVSNKKIKGEREGLMG